MERESLSLAWEYAATISSVLIALDKSLALFGLSGSIPEVDWGKDQSMHLTGCSAWF